MKKGFATWVTGLPGSGKTTIAKKLVNELKKKTKKVEYLRLDAFRKKVIVHPRYTEEERDNVYRELAFLAKELTDNGINVVIDATAHRKKWRLLARKWIKRFVEVYVKCPLEICIERESKRKQSLVTAKLYKKALERKKDKKKHKKLGQVIGVDVPYEVDKKAEMVFESDKIKPEEAVKQILKKLKV